MNERIINLNSLHIKTKSAIKCTYTLILRRTKIFQNSTCSHGCTFHVGYEQHKGLSMELQTQGVTTLANHANICSSSKE